MKQLRQHRVVVTIGLVAASLAMATFMFVGGAAAASSAKGATSYDVVNATVNAASDHEILGSTAFPNFTSGAVDNYYALAHTHIDNSPFAEGTASPADSGPLGQTAAAGNFQQPQYADARWPGKGGDTASFGNAPGPSASATAGSFKATADSSEASGSGGAPAPPAVPSPPGLNHRLRIALAAWKARWLAPLHIKLPGLKLRKLASLPINPPAVTVPTPALPGTTTSSSTTTSSTTTSSTTTSSAPSGPPANGAVVSSSSAEIDPKTGAVVTTGESALGQMNLGGGQIVLKGIHVLVSITNSGTPTDKVAVEVGSASIGGVPVTIDQDGVHVQGQGTALPYTQADDALNTALKQAGIQIFTVAPEIKKSANELAITATGVHVLFTQPVNQSGVPSQNVEHIVGEVFADSLATPAVPLPSLSLGGLAGLAGTGIGSTGGLTTGGSASGYSSSSTAAGTSGAGTQSAPTQLLSALSKPTWLLLAYLLWQALIAGTGVSLWRWRGGAT